MDTPSSRIQDSTHNDVSSEIGMSIDTDAEVALSQRTGTFTEPERSSSTVLGPAGSLRIGVSREGNLYEVDDSIRATGELRRIAEAAKCKV